MDILFLPNLKLHMLFFFFFFARGEKTNFLNSLVSLMLWINPSLVNCGVMLGEGKFNFVFTIFYSDCVRKGWMTDGSDLALPLLPACRTP